MQQFPTTIDNPFDYFTQFDDWYAFDTDKGYNTCAYLARIVELPANASEQEIADAINKATDEIVRMNVNGMYTRAIKN